MARIINKERCIQCGACLLVCPNEGISEVNGEYHIDANLCTECFGFHADSNCAAVCPVDAVDYIEMGAMSEEEIAGLASQLRPDAFPRD
jgi:ferredoxin